MRRIMSIAAVVARRLRGRSRGLRGNRCLLSAASGHMPFVVVLED